MCHVVSCVCCVPTTHMASFPPCKASAGFGENQCREECDQRQARQTKCNSESKPDLTLEHMCDASDLKASLSFLMLMHISSGITVHLPRYCCGWVGYTLSCQEVRSVNTNGQVSHMQQLHTATAANWRCRLEFALYRQHTVSVTCVSRAHRQC